LLDEAAAAAEAAAAEAEAASSTAPRTIRTPTTHHRRIVRTPNFGIIMADGGINVALPVVIPAQDTKRSAGLTEADSAADPQSRSFPPFFLALIVLVFSSFLFSPFRAYELGCTVQVSVPFVLQTLCLVVGECHGPQDPTNSKFILVAGRFKTRAAGHACDY
jgi:hypothetical protein